jgi:hypothetical protein
MDGWIENRYSARCIDQTKQGVTLSRCAGSVWTDVQYPENQLALRYARLDPRDTPEVEVSLRKPFVSATVEFFNLRPFEARHGFLNVIADASLEIG